MKVRFILFYCATVLLMENAIFAVALVANILVTDPEAFAEHSRSSVTLGVLFVLAAVMIPRVLFGQLLLNVLLHLRALSRARGYAPILKRSLLINAGTFAAFCLIVVSLRPSNEQFFDVTKSVQRGLIGWSALAATILAPIIALRLRRRWLLAREPSPAVTP